MPDDGFRYRAEGSTESTNQQSAGGASGGSQGGQSGGSSGQGGGGQSSGSNESRENPRYTGRGDSRNNNTNEGLPRLGLPYGQAEGDPDNPWHRFSDGSMNQSRSRQSGGEQSPNQSQGEQPKEENPMSYNHCPPTAVVAGGFPITPFGAGYGYPYAGYPTSAPSNIVVAGSDHNRGTHSQLETLSDIALGGLRESAAAGRTNQLSTQIESIGDRIDTQGSFNRELSLQKEFSTIHARFGDVENRLLTAMKEGEINRLSEDKNLLRAEVTDAREARRFSELRDELKDLTRLLRDRLPNP